MGKITLAVFIILGAVLILLSLLSLKNTCSEGGFAGKTCSCAGLKITKSQQDFPDGITEVICIGYIKK